MAFWYFYWEKGGCAPGSSGSGLFNAETKRLIGTLTAINDVGCATDLRSRLNWYGKLSYHWFANNENASQEQLRPWLDPTGSNLLYMDGSYRPANRVKETESSQTVQVYPNPATSQLRIQWPTAESGEIILYATDGTRVKHLRQVSFSDEICIADLPQGLYFITLIADKTADSGHHPLQGHAKFVKR